MEEKRKSILEKPAREWESTLVFRVLFRFSRTLNRDTRKQLMLFIHEAIEANELRFSEQTTLNIVGGVVGPKFGYAITEKKRKAVEEWLKACNSIKGLRIGPIVEAKKLGWGYKYLWEHMRKVIIEEGNVYHNEILHKEIFRRLNVDLAQLLLLIDRIRVEDLMDLARSLIEKGIVTPATKELAYLDPTLEEPFPAFEKVLEELGRPATRTLEDPDFFLGYLSLLVIDGRVSPVVAAFIGHRYCISPGLRIQTEADCLKHYVRKLRELSSLHIAFWDNDKDITQRDIIEFFDDVQRNQWGPP